MNLLSTQNYQNCLMNIEDSKLKHHRFRDTAYSITEKKDNF